MSVINKMLRDLDSRNASTTAQGEGVHSVPPLPARKRSVPQHAGKKYTALWGLCVLLLVAALLWQTGLLHPVPPVAREVVPVAAAPAPVAAPVAVPVSAPVVVYDVVAGTAAQPLIPELKPSLQLAPASTKPAPAVPPALPVPIAVPPTTLKSSPMASSPQPTSIAAVEVHRQQTASEAVANAQTLWNLGSREAAMGLLQDVLASGERSLTASSTALGAGLLALVRELTRMQLADARPGAAWDLLVHLEPQIRDEADLWAVRGNAAQRLARHQDSVHAYMAALQLRPGEQRWMLGAAVSLAALGKNDAAADMADKALAVGPISKDVQAYLRQMGVPLKD